MLRLLFAIALTITPATSVTAPLLSKPAESARALPLNRFPASRLTRTEKGFYFMPTAIGDDYFDGTSDVTRIRRHLRLAKELGVKYLRCAFSWNGIEKSQGHYDWAFWDQLVQEANAQGIGLIPYVAYTPEWAASKPEEFWRQPPRTSRLYSDFMFQIAQRYRGRVKAWEIWNEPDLAEYWKGSVEQFAGLVKETAVQIRRADPSAVVVLGGMSGGPNEFFQSLISTHHIDAYVDVVAMHAYAESWDEQRAEAVYQDRISQMEHLIENTGVDLWVNEMGYADYRSSPAHASRYGTNVYYRYEHTRQYSAAFLLKAHLMSLAGERVSLSGWYRLDDFPITNSAVSDDEVNYHLGLTDSTGKRKPAFYALRFFNHLFDQPARLLTSGSITHGSANSQSLVEIFEKQNGEFVVAGWLRSSHYNEVQRHTGMESDNRAEIVSVHLPCTRSATTRRFDSTGHPIANRTRFANGLLKNVVLTGDKVFVAEVHCERG